MLLWSFLFSKCWQFTRSWWTTISYFGLFSLFLFILFLIFSKFHVSHVVPIGSVCKVHNSARDVQSTRTFYSWLLNYWTCPYNIWVFGQSLVDLRFPAVQFGFIFYFNPPFYDTELFVIKCHENEIRILKFDNHRDWTFTRCQRCAINPTMNWMIQSINQN